MAAASGARPIPFERARVRRALADQKRVLLGVALVGLFAGAAVSRLSVPLAYHARAELALGNPQGALARGLDDALLVAGRPEADAAELPAGLRARLALLVSGPQRLSVIARASRPERAQALADGLAHALVARENASAGVAQDAVERELSGARRALEQAEAARTAAVAEGDAQAELLALRTRAAQLERQIAEARAGAAEAEARAAMLSEAQRTDAGGGGTGRELAQAQRALSLLLVERAENDPEVRAQRSRIAALRAPGGRPETRRGERAAARAHKARALELEAERELLHGRARTLEQRAAQIALRTEARDEARARITALEVDRAAIPARAEVVARAHVVTTEGRELRSAVAALTPVLALLFVIFVLVGRELHGFRICAATELAYWLRLPVLSASAWPGDEAALPSLLEELFDAAAVSVGSTLFVPLSTVERPLVHTLAAQLNRRAQRQLRSATGARIALVQAWEGELTGGALRRAAELADRVVWVVAADLYTRAELTERRAAVARTDGVAAILVDADVEGLAKRVGDVPRFWAARSEERSALGSMPPERVPLH